MIQRWNNQVISNQRKELMRPIDTALSAQPVYSSAIKASANNAENSDTNFQDVMGAATDPTQVGSQGSGYVTTTAVTSSAAGTPGTGTFGGPGATAAQLAILQAGPGGSSYGTYIETLDEVNAEQEPGYNQAEFNSYWAAFTTDQLKTQGGSVQTPAFIAYEGSNPEVVNAELEAAGLPPAFTNLTDTATTTSTPSGSSADTTDTAALQTAATQQSPTQPSAPTGIDPTQVGSQGSGYVTTTAVTSSAASTPGSGAFGGPGATAAQMAILQAGPGGSSYNTYIETQNEVKAEQEPGFNQGEFNTYWSALTSGQLVSEGGSVKTPAFIAYEGSNPETVNAELEAAGLPPAFTNLTDTTASNGSVIST
jgi:hypothetical protein